jgi:hypothetical protein
MTSGGCGLAITGSELLNDRGTGFVVSFVGADRSKET